MSKKVVIGVDIGGTYTKIGLIDLNGNVLKFGRIRTESSRNKIGEYLGKLYSNIEEIFPDSKNKCAGIGVSMLGIQMEDKSGALYSPNARGLQGLDIRSALKNKFNINTSVINDGVAHALAESYFGIGRFYDRLLNVTMGTGIGCVMIINGEPLEIFGGTSGDCGRIILDPDAEISCEIKIRGSAEALCGIKGIEFLAGKYYGEGKKNTAKDVIMKARTGEDETAVRIIEKIGYYLGHLLANLSVIFFPQVITVTGGIAEAGDVLIRACKGRFDELIGNFHLMLGKETGVKTVEIKKAVQASNAGIIGGSIPLLKPYIIKNK